MLQVKFLKVVLERTRPSYSNFAFPNSALLPTGIKVSKDLDLSLHSENQELFTALSSSKHVPEHQEKRVQPDRKLLNEQGLLPPAKSQSLLMAVILWKSSNALICAV